MTKSREEHLMNDTLLFYPIQYSNYINHIYNLLGDTNTPKVYMLIMLTLRKFGAMPISRIGEWVGIARPNMTAIIDGMTEKGWITRSVSPSDRRITNIEMTEEGLAYIKQLIDKLHVIVKEQFSKLTDEEVAKMMESLEYLVILGKKLIKV